MQNHVRSRVILRAPAQLRDEDQVPEHDNKFTLERRADAVTAHLCVTGINDRNRAKFGNDGKVLPSVQLDCALVKNQKADTTAGLAGYLFITRSYRSYRDQPRALSELLFV